MATFEAKCPLCGKGFNAEDEWAGQVGECPECGKDIRIEKPVVKQEVQAEKQPLSIKKETPQAVTATGRNWKKPIIACSALVVIAILVSSVYFGVKMMKNKSGTDSKTQSPVNSVSSQDSKQQAEREKLEKVKGSVEGGAWIVKGGGQSEVLRGLQVFLLLPEINPKLISAELIKLHYQCVEWERHKDEFKKLYPELYETLAPLHKVQMEYLMGWIDKPNKPIDTQMLFLTDRIVVKAFFSWWDYVENITYKEASLRRVKDDETWSSIVIASNIMAYKGVTDIDGKYQIPDVKPGIYIVYTQMSNNFSLIEWSVLTVVQGNQTTKLNLSNENAEHIMNK